jgi:hypothetical protein
MLPPGGGQVVVSEYNGLHYSRGDQHTVIGFRSAATAALECAHGATGAAPLGSCVERDEGRAAAAANAIKGSGHFNSVEELSSTAAGPLQHKHSKVQRVKSQRIGFQFRPFAMGVTQGCQLN